MFFSISSGFLFDLFFFDLFLFWHLLILFFSFTLKENRPQINLAVQLSTVEQIFGLNVFGELCEQPLLQLVGYT